MRLSEIAAAWWGALEPALRQLDAHWLPLLALAAGAAVVVRVYYYALERRRR